jgi:hypothetical protein
MIIFKIHLCLHFLNVFNLLFLKLIKHMFILCLIVLLAEN